MLKTRNNKLVLNNIHLECDQAAIILKYLPSLQNPLNDKKNPNPLQKYYGKELKKIAEDNILSPEDIEIYTERLAHEHFYETNAIQLSKLFKDYPNEFKIGLDIALFPEEYIDPGLY